MPARTVERTDEEIQHDVLMELRWDPGLQPNDIAVAVREGLVTLAGWVDSYNKKWAAERAVGRIRGVLAVADDVEVRLPVDAQRPDPDIAAAALRALQWDVFVPVDQVQVSVSDGWVSLRGEVEWDHERRAAEHAVRRLRGVRGVTNLITVQPKQPTPEQLRRQIEEALVRSAETDAEHINVTIEGGTVAMTGRVRSWVEKQEAERVAWSAPGVRAVDNRIAIG